MRAHHPDGRPDGVPRPLRGRTALVTGASRGVGKGIALELGAAGATVYLTARSSGNHSTVAVGGTVEQTAAEIRALGGVAVPVVCDHRDDGAVAALLAGIERGHGQLDLLVNNVWGGYEGLHAGRVHEWRSPFWEQPLELWDSMFAAGVRAHYVTSALASQLMVPFGSGLIVTVSFFPVDDASVAYRVAKVADDRMVADMADQLRPHGVAAVTLYPGLVRTEGILRVARLVDLGNSESPRFAGRAVAALAADPHVLARSGEVLLAAELADEYGFSDVDGRRPRSLRRGRAVVAASS
ncbi:MAG TPA: SDR family NAD(P)-dependent oxidoreductase [Actinomycetes bacterium]|nr:SDR family NAD(P)-dependent oxidoreductase [Actinomycetes bacterium]